MEKLGLIGGVSWVSTMEYYKRLNLLAHQRGGTHVSADLVIISLNFEEILSYQRDGNDEAEFQILLDAGKKIESVGARKLLICSNTTSNTCDRLSDELGIEIINIIDATFLRVKELGFRRVGLLGTRYVMEREFYRRRLEEAGIEVVVPNESNRTPVHNIIYNELCQYMFSPTSRDKMLAIIGSWANQGVEAVILGCTEIPLLLPNLTHYMGMNIIDSIDAHIELALGINSRINDKGRYKVGAGSKR
jgi:aspartate racemase